MEIVAKENVVTIMDHEEGSRTEEIAEDPLVIPRRIMEKWTPQLLDELPEAFCGILHEVLTTVYLLCHYAMMVVFVVCVIYMS